MKRVLRGTMTVAGLALLAACGGGGEAEVVAETEMVAEPAGGMEMGGMPMEGTAMEGADPLDAHMQMMENASGEELIAMLPEHRQLVANRIAQMNRDMRGMDMSDNTEWNSTVQALRDDLVRLPEMTGDELRAFIPEHQARIDKLDELYRGMMGDMQM